MPRIVPVVLLVALIVYAFIDCVRTPEESMPVGIPKVLWVVLILLFPGLGALAWLVVSRVARGGRTAPPGPRGPGPSGPAGPGGRGGRGGRGGGPVAPDDDPEFLARLEAERRQRERERRRREKEGSGGSGDGHGQVGGSGQEVPGHEGRLPQRDDGEYASAADDEQPHGAVEAPHGSVDAHPSGDDVHRQSGDGEPDGDNDAGATPRREV